MKFHLIFLLLVLESYRICTCSKETNGKREGFRSQEQAVVVVHPESVTVAEKATAGSAAKSNTGNSTKNKRTKKRISASEMMKSLKLACSQLKEFSVGSKYAQDLLNSAPTSELLSREFKQLDSEDQCGFASYSAALRIFLRTCSVVDACPMPSANPTYNFKLPNGGSTSKNGQTMSSKISQSYVAVPSAFAPNPVHMNIGRRNGVMVPRPVLNFARLSSSLPNWLPVVQMVRMQQAAQSAIASRLQQRNRLPTPAPLRRVTPESDATD